MRLAVAMLLCVACGGSSAGPDGAATRTCTGPADCASGQGCYADTTACPGSQAVVLHGLECRALPSSCTTDMQCPPGQSCRSGSCAPMVDYCTINPGPCATGCTFSHYVCACTCQVCP